MWQLFVVPKPPLKLELPGSQAMSPAATTTGSPADRVDVAVGVGDIVAVEGDVGVNVCMAVGTSVGVGDNVLAGVAVAVDVEALVVMTN